MDIKNQFKYSSALEQTISIQRERERERVKNEKEVM
jgi:hypothetical protein